ncbi:MULTISPECIES: hypothetical protein [Bacillus cereus group]|uniref:Uncharacterized protein n=1 Tax=Bacillus wiedmannii TaxID=1890302 RepID=A0AB73RJF7_9BACI|nr:MULTISPECIES: hypothetical protein [Bacillus cereus group]HDR4420985.1 hypothetical protein [Bacillus cereus]MBJ8082237.1 hypothetical protein [Bacillus cereus group sp. N14]MDI6678355.1 hypothetical protein [Bacillus wiedmannii]PEK24984.1 hypothetical protein CN694_11390 [Bacillus wiedmannii]PHG40212.1 hypothetical protein COI54_28395 [Bacillus wiedmannii]
MVKFKINVDREKLWNGCILTSIAHAISVAHYPESSYENTWDGFNYNIQNGSGAQGTITFHPDYCVIGLQDFESERFNNKADALIYFEEAPKKVIEIAQKETLQYLLEDGDEEDTISLITTGFWIEENGAYSMEQIEGIEDNGGQLLEKQLMDVTSAIELLEEEYELTEEQLKLLVLLYERKIKNPNKVIKLSENEIAMIGTDNVEGLQESKISFEQINITWES